MYSSKAFLNTKCFLFFKRNYEKSLQKDLQKEQVSPVATPILDNLVLVYTIEFN